MLTLDSTGLYTDIKNHDWIMENSNQWVDHYNFLLTLPWNDEWYEEMIKDELNEYKFYDV